MRYALDPSTGTSKTTSDEESRGDSSREVGNLPLFLRGCYVNDLGNTTHSQSNAVKDGVTHYAKHLGWGWEEDIGVLRRAGI